MMLLYLPSVLLMLTRSPILMSILFVFFVVLFPRCKCVCVLGFSFFYWMAKVLLEFFNAFNYVDWQMALYSAYVSFFVSEFQYFFQNFFFLNNLELVSNWTVDYRWIFSRMWTMTYNTSDKTLAHCKYPKKKKIIWRN